MLGASLNEIGLVALLLALVVIASKVGAIGEAIGGFFVGSSASSSRAARAEGAEKPQTPADHPNDAP